MRGDRPTVEVPADIVGESAGGCVASFGLDGERFQDDVVEIRRQAGLSGAGPRDGRPGRAAALRSAADSGSLRNAELRTAFVLLQYHGYMRRDPDDAGYGFWLGKLNQFNGNYVAAEMVKAFITSDEYQQRFGQ